LDCIGEKGELGTVTTATVLESEKKAYVTVATEDGVNHIIAEPISDEAMADYKAHPEAFFPRRLATILPRLEKILRRLGTNPRREGRPRGQFHGQSSAWCKLRC